MPLLSKLTSKRAKLGFLALCLAVGAPTLTFAQTPPKKEISDKVSEELGKIKTATDAKNYDQALATIDGLLKTAAPDSYDRAVLSQVKAQIHLTKGEFSASVGPLETAWSLGDKYRFFDDKTLQDLLYYLAQLYYQEAATSKNKEVTANSYKKAIEFLERWSATNPKPNPDNQIFFASVLYNYAQLDPANVDAKLIERAQQEVEEGLRMSTRPKDTFYVLLLATLQQQNQTEKSAEILELLVKQAPKNQQYWQQLASTYLALQKDVLAALTIERAQQQGIMNTPKDNFNLVGIYFNMGQFDYAIDLLEKGLKGGSIDNEQRNWELLAASYQQVRKEYKAIESLKEAVKLFPQAGSLDLQIAQIYYTLDKLEDAYKHAKSAVTKNLEKPWQAQTFLAYVAFELRRLDEGLAAINEAMKSPEGAKDAERLKRAIEDAIKEREALKAA